MTQRIEDQIRPDGPIIHITTDLFPGFHSKSKEEILAEYDLVWQCSCKKCRKPATDKYCSEKCEIEGEEIYGSN